LNVQLCLGGAYDGSKFRHHHRARSLKLRKLHDLLPPPPPLSPGWPSQRTCCRTLLFSAQPRSL
jgi:hypothetical protein